MDVKYMLRRLSFAGEVRGVMSKISLLLEELLSMSTRIRPIGQRSLVWMGPRGDIKLNYYDSIVCWRSEILDEHQYDVNLTSAYPIVLDIGANQGFFTTWIKYNYPEAIVHSYEPVKKSFEIIEKNVADNKFHNCTLHNFGVSDKDEFVEISHRPGGAGLGDSIYDTNEGYEKEQIRLCNLDPDFKNTPFIDLIKIDIEGGEYKILRNCNFWKKAGQIIIEFHDNFKTDNIDYIDLIKRAGFKLDKRTGLGAVYQCYFSKI